MKYTIYNPNSKRIYSIDYGLSCNCMNWRQQKMKYCEMNQIEKNKDL